MSPDLIESGNWSIEEQHPMTQPITGEDIAWLKKKRDTAGFAADIDRYGRFITALSNRGDGPSEDDVARVEAARDRAEAKGVAYINQADAQALRRLLGGGGVPDGWKLVPVEPTEAMIAPYRGLYLTRISRNTAKEMWSAMLSSSPEAVK